jgi:hypothetical protein
MIDLLNAITPTTLYAGGASLLACCIHAGLARWAFDYARRQSAKAFWPIGLTLGGYGLLLVMFLGLLVLFRKDVWVVSSFFLGYNSIKIFVGIWDAYRVR